MNSASLGERTGLSSLASRRSLVPMPRSARQKERWQGKRARHADLGAALQQHDEEGLFAHVEGLPEPFLLVLDGIQDPHNLGACLRTAEAAGCDAVVFPKNRAAPLTETVRVVASGAAESLFLARIGNLARTLEGLRERGVHLVATSDAAGATLYEADLSGSLGVVVGAEGGGVRRLTADLCDVLVSIPMAGQVPCLNVSVAAGVCLFEAVRQRGEGA